MNKNDWLKLFRRIEPEIKELFPEPGSFSGLLLFNPFLWVEIFKLKLKKSRSKK